MTIDNTNNGTIPQGDPVVEQQIPVTEQVQETVEHQEAKPELREVPEFLLMNGRIVMGNELIADSTPEQLAEMGFKVPTQTEGQPEGQQEQVKTEQPEGPQMYTSDEMRDLTFDKLDPTRIPPELMPFYKSMQAGFTRSMQANAEQKKQYEAFIQSQQRPAPQPQAPPDPIQQVKFRHEQLAKDAMAEFESIYGEYFDNDPIHRVALSDIVANRKAMEYAQQNKVYEVQSVMSEYVNDPEWSSIDKFAADMLQKMPFNVSQAIQAKIAQGDTKVLNKFLAAVRDEFRNLQHPKSTPAPAPVVPIVPIQVRPQLKPPSVEGGGPSMLPGVRPKPDYAALGKMTMDQQAQWFRDRGLDKQ